LNICRLSAVRRFAKELSAAHNGLPSDDEHIKATVGIADEPTESILQRHWAEETAEVLLFCREECVAGIIMYQEACSLIVPILWGFFLAACHPTEGGAPPY